MSICSLPGGYTFCIALVQLALNHHKKFAWPALVYVLVYLAAIPYIDHVYGYEF